MQFDFRVRDAAGAESVVPVVADDRAAAVAKVKARGLTPLGIREVRPPEPDDDDDDDDEDYDSEIDDDDDNEDDEPPRKAYRLICTLNAGTVALQTVVWVFLTIVTSGCVLPFFGYFYIRLIINHTRIEECDPLPKRHRR